MKEHIPYQERFKREPDFIVEYEIDLCEELKDGKPTQGMRVDFLYDGERPNKEGVHMIWPEILDKDGKVFMDTTPGAVPKKGYANMWVLDEKRRNYHKLRIKEGVKGHWWRGGIIAKVEVIQVGSLNQC